jgi:hypothetical protein
VEEQGLSEDQPEITVVSTRGCFSLCSRENRDHLLAPRGDGLTTKAERPASSLLGGHIRPEPKGGMEQLLGMGGDVMPHGDRGFGMLRKHP